MNIPFQTRMKLNSFQNCKNSNHQPSINQAWPKIGKHWQSIDQYMFQYILSKFSNSFLSKILKIKSIFNSGWSPIWFQGSLNFLQSKSSVKPGNFEFDNHISKVLLCYCAKDMFPIGCRYSKRHKDLAALF